MNPPIVNTLSIRKGLCFTLLVLGFNAACTSWGKFWEIDSELSACRSRTVNDSLEMICVPANTSGFLRGSNVVGVQASPEHTVASIRLFALAKYEISYAQWLAVKTWATTGNGYVFALAGTQGNSGGGTNQQPVTTINWRDAIIWCNAASQKEGLNPVYFTDAAFSLPLKTATSTTSVNSSPGSEDNPYINWSANGYRLPTGAEWEYAARYVDGRNYTRGDAPSGWLDNNPGNGAVDTGEISAVAWYTTNAGGTTHPVGTAATNALGFTDMAGNIFEWTSDWFTNNYANSSPYTDADSQGGPAGSNLRATRGGAYSSAATELVATKPAGTNPWNGFADTGFRPARRP